MSAKVDKDAMACNKPRRTPSHPTSSHVVKACEGGKEKIIHFGQQGVKGSPKKAGESESYRKRREAFKARHAKNIAKGKMSAAYWANRVKWAEGGSVDLKDYDDPFAKMNVLEKAADLIGGGARGAWYLFTEPTAYGQHLYSPDRYLEEFRKTHPEMGSKKADRSMLDAALNYAEAYDWAARPEVSPEAARAMASSYQLWDYLKPSRNPAAEVADYQQNMAGVEQALKDRAANVVRKQKEIADLAHKYALAEQSQGRVLPAPLPQSATPYDPKRVDKVVKKLAKGGEFTDPVESEVEKQFGMKPGLDRATFLPFAGRRSEGNLEWAVPGTIYELAKAYVLPGMAAQGYQVTPEESVQFASNLMGGAGTGSAIAPVEGTIAGMAVKGKGKNPVKTATVELPVVSSAENLFTPELVEKLGPVGTMNFLQTLALSEKAQDILGLPKEVSVLKALSNDPAAMEKLQRFLNEKKTGLESPTRRKVLKGAVHLAAHAAVPAPVTEALVKKASKASAGSIPDESIQAAFATHMRDKLDEYKNTDWNELFQSNPDLEEEILYPGEKPAKIVDVAQIASNTGIPEEELKGYLKRNKLDPDQILEDYRRKQAEYKVFSDDVSNVGNALEDFVGFEAGPLAEKFLKQKKLKGPVWGEDASGMHDLLLAKFLNSFHSNLNTKLPALLGKEASPYVDNLNDAFKATGGGEYFGELLPEALDEHGLDIRWNETER